VDAWRGYSKESGSREGNLVSYQRKRFSYHRYVCCLHILGRDTVCAGRYCPTVLWRKVLHSTLWSKKRRSLRNVGTHLPVYKSSHPRIQQSQHPPLCEPNILCSVLGVIFVYGPRGCGKTVETLLVLHVVLIWWCLAWESFVTTSAPHCRFAVDSILNGSCHHPKLRSFRVTADMRCVCLCLSLPRVGVHAF
jgi:hypothetical protein